MQNLTRRNFIKAASVTAAAALAAGTLTACGDSSSGATVDDFDYSNWDAVLEAAKGQTCSWYGWGGDEARNTWIETILAPQLKDKYEVTLELVPMDINDILTKLSGEIQAGTEEGSIDFIWINGENFFSAKQNGYLWGPFTNYLPNFNTYIDTEAAEVLYDFGSPVEGYECPYQKSQVYCWVDSAKVDMAAVPKTPEQLLQFCKDHPGQFTYPEPGDFTGTAIISCIIANVIGKDEFEKLSQMSTDDATAEAVLDIVGPGLDFLRELKPYLWKEGKTYPADSPTYKNMYEDGELIMNMGYGSPQTLVNQGTLPDTTRSFLFDGGTCGNSNFMAIAANSASKPAALVAINEMTSPEMQLSQYKELGIMTPLDMTKLSTDEKAAFDKVELGVADIPVDELLGKRVAEASGPVIPVLEALWLEKVAAE